MLDAIQDAFEPVTPVKYFRAMFDDQTEADAMHALHAARVASQQTQTRQIE